MRRGSTNNGSSALLALKIVPSSVEFAVVPDATGTASASEPINRCTLRLVYDPASPSSSPSSLLTFSVRASAPELLRVKGGWGQLLSLGEEAVVEVSLRKASNMVDLTDVRLWVAYELLDPSNDPDFSEISKKWKEQRRIRGTGQMVGSRSGSINASSALWKGRNFDLLNSHSIVVPCRVTVVTSAGTAELDLLRDRVRLRKSQLSELEQSCETLLEQSKTLLQRVRLLRRRRRLGEEETPVEAKGKGGSIFSLKSVSPSSIKARLQGIESMEFVGLLLVISTTALMAISL